jgi:hypothetical protein
LNNARAKYLLVGGYAVAFHGQPRFTKDLDVWIESTVENADAVYSALTSFCAPLQDVTAADLTRTGLILQIGVGSLLLQTPPDPRTGQTSIVLDPLEWIHRISTRTSPIPDNILDARMEPIATSRE